MVIASGLVAASCLDSGSHECANGFLCPARLVCAPGQNACMLPDQLSSCAGKSDGAMWRVPTFVLGTSRRTLATAAFFSSKPTVE
jgi:hypothetical protein